MHYTSIPLPPLPSDPSEAARWEHTRLRRRMLYGAWREDLDRRISWSIGAVRREAWGVPDLSSNVFRSSIQSLAVLYDRRPTITHNDQTAADQLAGLVVDAGFWPLMQRVQRDTLGMREMLIRVDVSMDSVGSPVIVYRPVYPDMVLAGCSSSEPDRPIEIRELRLRTSSTGQARWTWDVLSIADPAAPSYRVLAAGSGEGEDLSAEYLGTPGGLVGEAYPYRRADGAAFLPYVMYHAAKTGMLWDAYEASELVDGSLNVAVLWTFFGHTVRQASWPQRYAVGVRVPSASIDGETEQTIRESVIPDPATVLLFEPSDEGVTPQISQWAPGSDPQTLQEAIAMYERRIAAFAGISPADVQRVAGDPRSGFALAISREAAREAQRRYEPVFSPADEEVLAITASMLNAAAGLGLPEGGYRVAYETLPPSVEERQGEREHLLALIDAGLLDRVSAYQTMHPGISRADAERALIDIQLEESRMKKTIESLEIAEQTIGASTGGAPEEGAAQDTALNGAQIASLLQVIGEVAARRLPRESAIAILVRSFNVSGDAAESLLGPVGTSFFIEGGQNGQ